MNNLIVSRTGIESKRTITERQMNSIPIAEFQNYSNILIIDSEKEIDKKYIEQFIVSEFDQESDYTLLAAENRRICYAVSVATNILSKKIILSASKHLKKGDLYEFCCELKNAGHLGKAILIDNDYLESIIKEINVETGETYKQIEFYLSKYCHQYKNIYIYGAGKYGHRCLSDLRGIGIQVKAFIETNKTIDEVDRIPVKKFDEVTLSETDAVILALKKDFCFQVLPLLVNKGIMNYCIYPFWMT